MKNIENCKDKMKEYFEENLVELVEQLGYLLVYFEKFLECLEVEELLDHMMEEEELIG